jgi:hypothetical protein
LLYPSSSNNGYLYRTLYPFVKNTLTGLQVRKEEPGLLQVRRLKPFGEPGIQVAELPFGVAGSLLRDV